VKILDTALRVVLETSQRRNKQMRQLFPILLGLGLATSIVSLTLVLDPSSSISNPEMELLDFTEHPIHIDVCEDANEDFMFLLHESLSCDKPKDCPKLLEKLSKANRRRQKVCYGAP